MIGFRLDEEHEELRKSVEEFTRNVVATVISETTSAAVPLRHRGADGPDGAVRAAGRRGVGGMGGDYFALCLALEELGRVDSSVAITLKASVSLGVMPIYRYGRESRSGNGCRSCAPGRCWPRSG